MKNTITLPTEVKEITVKRYITADYSIFEELPENRNAEQMTAHQKELGASMTRHGFLECQPLLVVKKKDKYLILDGQNRYRQAVKMGIDVVFEILNTNDSKLMRDLQIAKGWALKDYIHNYITTGESESVGYVNSLVSLYPKAQAGTIASILGGSLSNGTNEGVKGIRNGDVKMRYKEETEKTLLFITLLEGSPLPDRIKRELWKRPFMKTIYIFMRNSEFNSGRLYEKMLAFHTQLLVYNTIPEYFTHLEEVYNKHTRGDNQTRFAVRPSKK